MSFYNVILMALGLGMDAMSVCMGIGVRWHGPRQMFRLSWHMGLFQFLMPIIGFLAGEGAAGLLSFWGRPLAAAMVFAVGGKMLYEALKSHPGAVAQKAEDAAEHAAHHGQAIAADPTRGWSLMVLSVATSVDALVVGFSLGLQGQVQIWWPSVVIGLVAGGMSLLGVVIGRHVGQKLGKRAEIVGAVILMLLAVSFLLPMF